MRSEKYTDLVEAVHAWDEAMVANDAEAISRFMAADWTIVGADGRITTRDPFLAQIASGDLTHDTMTSEDLAIRMLGDCAIVVARGVSAGVFRGTRFHEHERSSNVFVRRDGRWVCVHTHLSSLAQD